MPELPRQSSAPVARGGSSIEWTEDTINLQDGCRKVSPGCAHCYIERQTPMRVAGRRFEGGEIPLRFHPHRLEQPVRRRKPTIYFVNSMSDIFHEESPAEYVARTFAMMAASPQHTFQVLTKRHERMRALLSSGTFRRYVAFAAAREHGRVDFADSPDAMPWPLPNVWLGVTIENRRFIHRADYLRETPAAVRFISAEPLLGPLVPHGRSYDDRKYGWYTTRHFGSEWNDDPGLDLAGIDWLIVGGESGPNHRPMKAMWARDLRDACLGMRRQLRDCQVVCDGGPAFLFKQWGGVKPKSGGRELDGRTWDEMPEVAAA